MNCHNKTTSTIVQGLALDIVIADLVDYLFHRGVKVIASCQGDVSELPSSRSSSYLLLHCAEDLAHATKILADVALRSGDETLATRILGRYSTPLGPHGELIRAQGEWLWRYELLWVLHPWWIDPVQPLLVALLRFGQPDLIRLSHLLHALPNVEGNEQ